MKTKKILRPLSIGLAMILFQGCASLKSEVKEEQSDTQTRKIVIGERVDKDKFDKWISSFRPTMTEPVIEKKFIPDQIRGNVYETGHWVYLIRSQSSWRAK